MRLDGLDLLLPPDTLTVNLRNSGLAFATIIG